MHAMQYPSIEQIVEIDTVAAGSHMETKRGIDYMQIYITLKYLVIVGAVVDTMLSTPSYTDLNLKLSHIRQGTSCTAQPTVDGILKLSMKKAKRLFDN